MSNGRGVSVAGRRASTRNSSWILRHISRPTSPRCRILRSGLLRGRSRRALPAYSACWPILTLSGPPLGQDGSLGLLYRRLLNAAAPMSRLQLDYIDASRLMHQQLESCHGSRDRQLKEVLAFGSDRLVDEKRLPLHVIHSARIHSNRPAGLWHNTDVSCRPR